MLAQLATREDVSHVHTSIDRPSHTYINIAAPKGYACQQNQAPGLQTARDYAQVFNQVYMCRLDAAPAGLAYLEPYYASPPTQAY